LLGGGPRLGGKFPGALVLGKNFRERINKIEQLPEEYRFKTGSQSGRGYKINDEGELLMNVEYIDQRIRVIDSSCPLKVCENTGWVENPNQPIICIPNEIIVKPLGTEDDTEIDIYTW